jgi:type IV secretion system protein TrbB
MALIVNEEARERLLQSLQHALGEVILGAMRDKSVVEIMVNPDGKIWVDRIGRGRQWTGEIIDAGSAERVLRTLATHAGISVTADQPRVSATIPETGERFQGALPPLVSAPAFAIRKRPESIFRLSGEPDAYVETGVMTTAQAAVIRQAVIDRQNIVVAGGTGSGKTTLLNAILAEEAFSEDRVVIIEDTRELQCSASDCVQFLTKQGANPVRMSDLVFDVLRLRPDRIIGGEVRDGATALNLLKAWNTGHPGGCTSIHANSAYEALSRFEDLIGEVTSQVPYRAIGQSINVVVFVHRTARGRRVQEVIQVEGYAAGKYVLRSPQVA